MTIEENGFIHHVYFWLKNPESHSDFEQLIDGLQKLSKVKTIQQFHIGKPAATRREVIDSTYSVSWLLVFEDKDGHDSYQVDPIHLKFVEECAPLWSRVVIYDTVSV
ncbi:MAG TPA: Dabb family protein [Hanamia sp.]